MSARKHKKDIFVRILIFATVAFLVLYPLSMMLIGSFRTEMPGQPGTWGFKGYVDAYTNPEFLGVIWTTVKLAVYKTLIAVSMAVAFAWSIHRTNMPGRKMLDSALHFSFFFLPPLPILLGWMILFSPRKGVINDLFMQIFNVDFPLFNVYSLAGIVITSVTFSVPFYYMFISPAFRSMDITLEEAAKVSGASDFTVARKVILPLLMPAILAAMVLSFIRGMESFEAPFFLGGTVGINVLSTQIYDFINSEPTNFMAALATGVTLLAITFALVVLQWKLLGSRQYVTVTGKGFRPRRMNLGRWRWPVFILLFGIFGLLTFPAAIVLVQTSFMKEVGIYSGLSGGPWTLRNYSSAFSHPDFLRALKNTVILAFTAPTLGMLICTVVSYVVVKTKYIERKALDLIAWIPWAVPGIVMSQALLWAWIFVKPFGFSLYGSLCLVILVLITVGFPIGTRIMTSTMVQISKELEEAALVYTSWFHTLLYIWLPLLRNGFLSGWIIAFTAAVRVLAPVILLISPASTVISTTLYDFWYFGDVEEACVIGLTQGALIVAGYLFIKALNRALGGKVQEDKTGLEW